MTEVFFYHLERSTPDEVLPNLLEKTLKRGWRALVKVAGSEEASALDEHLWTYRDESFLPHGIGDAAHPVLISEAEADAPENGAKALFLTPGTSVGPDAMEAFERVVLLFDYQGAEGARSQWRILKDLGFAVTYWKQSPEGAWQQAGA